MLKKLSFLVVLLLLFSCEKEGEFTTPPPQNESVIIDPAVELIALSNGTFTPTSGISVTGEAVIYQNGAQRYVSLENFSISSGPDLKVYLSATASPNMFVNLGNLTAATKYTIPQQVDLTAYKYVLIHCQEFNHLYAIAQLN